MKKNCIKNKNLIILDFYADWCPPCKLLAPIIEEIKGIYKGIEVNKINVDNDNKLAKEFNIEAVPTLVFLIDKKEISREVGFLPKNKIEEKIKEVFLPLLKEDILKELNIYGKKAGYKLNPNNSQLDNLITTLAMNILRYREPYCPCRIEKIPENICPCIHHRKEIEELGKCLCGLFFK